MLFVMAVCAGLPDWVAIHPAPSQFNITLYNSLFPFLFCCNPQSWFPSMLFLMVLMYLSSLILVCPPRFVLLLGSLPSCPVSIAYILTVLSSHLCCVSLLLPWVVSFFAVIGWMLLPFLVPVSASLFIVDSNVPFVVSAEHSVSVFYETI